MAAPAGAAMSGGQQTRAALARLVIADPDLLLLDEPTNHLDLGALEWLEEHLRRRTGSLLVASHDRAFLDATVTRIWELRDRRVTAFRGDYSAYHRQRVERDERAAKDAATHTGDVAHERELIQRYRSHRKFSKMHEHEARLERLEADRVEAPKARKRLRLPTGALAGGGPARSGETVVTLEGLVVGYLPDREHAGTAPAEIARAPWLTAARGERIGIVGPNGAGKTTLLRTIAGDLPPLDGRLAFGNAVQVGYLAQLREAAIPGTTVLDALLQAMPVTAGEARGYLARFLFRGDDAFKEVRSLSGGERSRLELALLGIMPANLLLLDEPTNHLDIPAREAIEAFLTETPATIVVVSHDRRLLETICERLWVVDDALCAPFEGGYRAWRAAVADGWTVAAAVEAEAKRLHGGARLGTTGRLSTLPSSSNGHKGIRGGPARRGPSSRGRGGGPSTGSDEALEGPVPTPEDGGRRRPDPTRPPQEPPGTRDGRPEGAVELHRAPADRVGTRRCRGRAGRGGGGVAGTRGSGAVSGSSDATERHTVRIGLTGPIGCGKSTVAGWLGELGAVTIDADEVAREVTAPGLAATEAVIARFGEGVRVAGGGLDRAALARIVFSDPAALADLEAIVHPAVRERIVAEFANAEADRAPAVVVEAIKLVEGGLAALCDEVWLVTCEPCRTALAPSRARFIGGRRRPPDRCAGRHRRRAAGGDPDHRHERVAVRGPSRRRIGLPAGALRIERRFCFVRVNVVS